MITVKSKRSHKDAEFASLHTVARAVGQFLSVLLAVFCSKDFCFVIKIGDNRFTEAPDGLEILEELQILHVRINDEFVETPWLIECSCNAIR